MRKRILTTLFAVVVSAFALMSCIEKPGKPDGTTSGTSASTLDHLVIEEVFTVGTLGKEIQPIRKRKNQKVTLVPYDKANDQYIKIYNPTNEVKYLDGFGIASSVFSSAEQKNLSPADSKIKDEVLGCSFVFQFSGTGKQYAIKPGESVLVAAQAINHTAGGMESEESLEIPAKALDLSGAMFQWIKKDDWSKDCTFNKVGSAADVTILYTQDEAENIKLPFQGMIALVDLTDPSRVAELKDDKSTWSIIPTQTTGSHTHATSMKAKKVPNSWIIDAVNMCPTNSVAWRVASATLDDGAASTLETPQRSANKFKKEDFSKSIRRKHDGKSLVDTNNSNVDFVVGDPSLLQSAGKKGEEKKVEEKK